jgi:hypothetical protein
MNSRPEPTQRTYTEAELAGLFATYFSDKLSQSQVDSLVTTVAEAHANRRARAAPSAKQVGPVVSQPTRLRPPGFAERTRARRAAAHRAG